MDIKHYMQHLGIQARAASREMAKASTRTKNLALTTIAAAIRREFGHEDVYPHFDALLRLRKRVDQRKQRAVLLF